MKSRDVIVPAFFIPHGGIPTMKTTKYPEKEGVTCIICKKGFSDEEWENRHSVHKAGCPFQNDEEPQCDCSDVAHENHCPHCILHNLEEHLPLDMHGNIYTVTVDQVKNTALEFIRKNPDLIEKIASLDKFSLAVEIQDCIGGVGMSDHIEIAIEAAIIDRIDHEIGDEDDE